MPDAPPHIPVLLEEVKEALVRPGATWFLDGTVGAGGHSRMLLEAAPEAQVLGLDRDPTAIELARGRLADLGERLHLVNASFADVAEVVRAHGLDKLDGVLVDLGFSSMQVDQGERGFSFQQEGPLDMRMDPSDPVTAQDLLDQLREEELANLIYELGEEHRSRRIARAIVEARRTAPITTTTQLAEVVRRSVPPPRGRRRRTRLHPATSTFQALRMSVNDELGHLERGLPVLFDLLAPGARLAVISFHSLEDRRVKQFFKQLKKDGLANVLTKKPLRPGEAEVDRNPRSRSARLRVAERN